MSRKPLNVVMDASYDDDLMVHGAPEMGNLRVIDEEIQILD